MGKAFLIRPDMSRMGRLMAYVAGDLNSFDPNHQIYVPNSFVLGNFKKREDGFKLSRNGIFYRNSPEALKKYSESLDAGKMEIVRSFEVRDFVLENLIYIGGQHLNHKEHISRIASELLD